MITVFIGNGCSRHMNVISTFDLQINETLGIKMPFPTVTGDFSVSKAILGSLECKPGQNILTSGGFNISKIKMNDTSTGSYKSPFEYFHDFRNLFNKTLRDLNIRENVNSAKEKTSQFMKSFQLIQFNYTSTISSYRVISLNFKPKNQLSLVKSQLSNLTQFGFDQTPLDKEMNDLNTASEVIQGTYWTELNVTLLDPNSAPYNQNSNYFQLKKGNILQLLQSKFIVLLVVKEVEKNLTILGDRLNDIQRSLGTSENLKNSILQFPQMINTEVNSIEILVNDLVSKASQMFGETSFLIDDVFNTIERLSSCDGISKFYHEQVQNNFCGVAMIHTSVVTFCGFLISLLLCCLVPIQWMASKRIGNPLKELKFNQNEQQMKTLGIDPDEHPYSPGKRKTPDYDLNKTPKEIVKTSVVDSPFIKITQSSNGGTVHSSPSFMRVNEIEDDEGNEKIMETKEEEDYMI
jgi:hypothetical protein